MTLRNPVRIAVSMAHFARKERVSSSEVRNYIVKHLRVITSWEGLWFVLSGGNSQERPLSERSHLTIFYERLLARPQEGYRELVTFLGLGIADVDDLIHRTSAGAMRKMERDGTIPGGSWGGRVKVRVAGTHDTGSSGFAEEVRGLERWCEEIMESLLPAELLDVWMPMDWG